MIMRATNLRLALSASAIALFALPGAASAATCVWNGGTGNWSPAGGWSACAVPTSGDDVLILLGGSVVNINGITAQSRTINLGSGNALNVTNSDLYVYNNSFTNNGTFTIGGAAGTASFLSGAGNVTFGGTGTIVLNDLFGAARMYNNGFIFGSGQTVRGSGQLGINSGIFSNAGLISADVSGRSISIDATGGSGGLGGGGFGTGGNAGFYNTATMEAKNGGTLSFEGGLYENSGTGVIQALAGSAVNLNSDSRIVGGTLTSVGTGVINAINQSQYVTDVTLSSGSNLKVQNDNLYVKNTLVNNGTITLGGAAGTASLINETGTLTISGSGTIVLDSSQGAARIYNGNIVFGSNQSLRGAGQLGINSATVTNNGLFSANSGSNLSIDVTGGSGGLGGGGVGTGFNAGLLNNNIMEATGNSTISFENGLYENALGGIIRATNNSIINLNSDSRILGGTLSTDATSNIYAINQSQYLTNVTLASGSRLLVQNDNLYANTTLTNNGTITLGGSAGTASLINETGTLAINGTGTIILDNSQGAARLYNGNFTFGAGQTVQGAGQLGINSATFTINNVFSANAGSTLQFDVTGGSGGLGGTGVGTGGNAGLLNTSTIQATGGSTLDFAGGLYENSASGVIQALAGSTVNLNSDSRILGGTLTSVGTGIITAFNNTQYLTDVTLSSGSNLKVLNDSLYAKNTLVNNGTITLGGSAGTASLINETGTLTISGTGTIVLDSSQGAARIYNGNIVFGSNQSLRGAGQLGINSATVTNNGLFSANSGSNLSIDVTGGSGGLGGGGVGTGFNAGLLNNNIMEATGNSTISFENGLYENALGGIIRATNNSIINLNSDSRILGGTLSTDATSNIYAINQSQYLTNVTLASGSRLTVQNDDLRINTTLTNNGTMTLGGSAGTASLIGETGTWAVNGTGTVVLDNSGGAARIYNGAVTFGSGETVRGSGQIGINSLLVTNNGMISGDAGTGISIDVSGGSGGIGGGVGTGGVSGLLNNGTIQALNGKTLSLESGRYENSATGSFGAVGAGSNFVMNSDANLTNLQGSGFLSLGNYISSTTGAASTLNLRGTGANSISTIGTGSPGQDTVVTLSGANSAFNVLNFSSGAPTTLDSTLTTVAQSGALRLLNNRGMTIVANSGTFSNAGFVDLGGGTFSANTFTNSGAVSGFGTVAVNIANTGSVTGTGGTLATQTITGTSGAVMSNAGGIIDISAGASNSTAGSLVLNGGMGLGTRSITVTGNYANAAFGSGNAFNNHANVTGSGQILAANATMDLSGPLLSGNVINLGNVRAGGSSATTLTITNNGTLTDLVGAVKNSNAPGIALTGADWTANAGGGFATVGVSFTGLTAGALTGQTLDVVNNFDNVAYKTIGVTGNVYQVANPIINNASSFINVGPVLVGTSVTQALSISNSQVAGAVGFQEGLNASWGSFTGNAIAGAIGSITNLAAGATNSNNMVLTFDTTTAGSKSGSIAVLLATNGTGTSGLGTLGLPTQNLAVSSTVITGTVLNPAVATIVSPQPVTVATQRVGGTNTGAITVRNDGAPPSAGLDGSFASATGAVSGSGSFTNIATGTTSSNIAVGVDTTTSGIKTGTATLNFASNLGPNPSVALASQTVNVTGTVTELASAAIFKNAGLGVFAGSGNAFTLDLGSLTANSGAFTTDLGVTNLVVPSAFAELLGGSFTQGAGAGYSFTGNSFSGLVGGTSNLGNLLSFDTTGLANGTYTKQVTFNGFSRYTGLTDFTLTPINVNITATVTGNVVPGAVPEPATWMMMLFGFGLVGSAMRRNRVAVARQLA